MLTDIFLSKITLPHNLKVGVNDETIKISLNSEAVKASMLDESSAFEGWMFCIRSVFKKVPVILNWAKPVYSEDIRKKQNQILHYHRFLLRVYWCIRNFDWFNVDSGIENEISDFLTDCVDVKINYPITASKDKTEREIADKVNKGEAILETKIYHKLNELLPASANHQLPVGLFKSEISKQTALTPRQGSQIDLWQIDRSIFRVFELKDKTNISVSIITELMYYANIFHNVFISRKINYPIDAFNLKEKKIFRSFNLITNALIENSITDIEAVFLAEKLHPLIEGNLQKILQDLNENSSNIIFSYKKVTDYI